ncbi:fimbrial protein [Providencia rettgeri]|uniref:fimbrial protein n=1 Tax=Providencia rettgeri TaxID=587 RepID=UPI0018E4BBFB|nr:fimbrial protein [Providencia rettgeri]MBI6194826.1 fimbrial protein [Providencia rettgeri]
MKLSILFRGGLFALCCTVSMFSQAIDVNFTGNLIDNPPCDVLGLDGTDQPIKISFGDVGITNIDGVNYRQDFALKLSCGVGLGNMVALFLQYGDRTGVVAPFDDNALQTSTDGLGIRLYYQGNVIPPKTAAMVAMSDNGTLILPLYAVPVKALGTTLFEGDFTAVASVEMNYP